MVRAIIYTAPKCPHSQNLKNYLTQNGVDFEERCIIANPEAVAEIMSRTQQMGIPVAVVDNEVFIGFDRRTERRLGRLLGV
jgi:glutaredoxin